MEKGLTKNHTKMLQGLAILMMLYHHLFSTPLALGIPYYSVLKFGDINIELKMAWFFKICVAIYAFVSGYGLSRALSNKRADYGVFNKLKNDYLFSIKRLISFYGVYWLVFVVFVPLGFIFFDKTFEIKEFLLNFFGIESTYNGAWWYVFFYLKVLITLPLLNLIFTHFKGIKELIKKYIFIVVLGLLIYLFYLKDETLLMDIIESFQPAFYLSFLMGYLISRFKIYEFFSKILPKNVLYFLGLVGLILVIVIRVRLAKDASSAGLDFILVCIFAYGFSVLTNMFSFLQKPLLFFGKYSTIIWLTHVFFYDHYAKNIVMYSHISTFIYITLLLLSTLTAIVLTKVIHIFKHIFL